MKNKKLKFMVGSFIISLVSWVQGGYAQVSQSQCAQDYNQAIQAATEDWQDNLNQLKDQQKPASEMVDEAYENLRTYNCWLEYICRSVQYSGYGPVESGIGGLTFKQLGAVPGCQMPDDLTWEGNFNDFIESQKSVKNLGLDPNTFYQTGRINYFPSCQTDPVHNNQTPSIIEMNDNFEACKASIERKFGCSQEDVSLGLCSESSSAIMMVESTLKKVHADQKSSALEQKLTQIMQRMLTMQEHVTYMKNFLSQLDQRLACIAFKCT